jgi:hypothetical protein
MSWAEVPTMTSTIVPDIRALRQHALRDNFVRATTSRPIAAGFGPSAKTSPTSVYWLAMMDRHDCVADRHVLRTLPRGHPALGSPSSHRRLGGLVHVVGDPDDPNRHGRIPLCPVGVKRRCLLAGGDRVLFAADHIRHGRRFVRMRQLTRGCAVVAGGAPLALHLATANSTHQPLLEG